MIFSVHRFCRSVLGVWFPYFLCILVWSLLLPCGYFLCSDRNFFGFLECFSLVISKLLEPRSLGFQRKACGFEWNLGRCVLGKAWVSYSIVFWGVHLGESVLISLIPYFLISVGMCFGRIHGLIPSLVCFWESVYVLIFWKPVKEPRKPNCFILGNMFLGKRPCPNSFILRDVFWGKHPPPNSFIFGMCFGERVHHLISLFFAVCFGESVHDLSPCFLIPYFLISRLEMFSFHLISFFSLFLSAVFLGQN